MRVIVAGGTGFIGRALCAVLCEAGHEPVVLSRRAGAGRFAGAVWDGASSGPWQSALDGAEAVVNLSGESVADGRWTAARKKALVDSRLMSTRALVAGLSAAKTRPKVFISASAVGYYGDRGDEDLSEGSSAGAGFLAKLCVDWEREARVAEALGVRTVCLRIGHVLHPEGGALGKMLTPFRLGLGGPLGSGRQWMSWISREDLARMILFLIGSGVLGAVNGTAPNPVTNKEFSAALGRALRRPAVLPAPGLALRIIFGEFAEALLGGQRVLPAAALKAGFAFRHPDIDSALAATLR